MSPVSRTLWAGLLILACAEVIAPRPAQAQMTIQGVFNGTYRCGQGVTNLKLSIIATGDNLSALFTFYLPPGTQKQGHTFSLQGTFNPRLSNFTLTPARWETVHPADFNMVGLSGLFDSDVVRGNVVGANCGTFYLERDREESANIVAVMAAQTRVAAPLPATAPAPQRGSTTPPPRNAGSVPPPASRRGGAPPQSPRTTGDTAAAEKALVDLEKNEARMKNPLLTWSTTSTKDITARTFVRVPSDTIRVTAICGSNGVSVKFSLQSLVGDPLQFNWYEARDDDGLVSDVRVSPDNGVPHVARGYAEKTGDTYFGNNLAMLFYDAATRARADGAAGTGVRQLDSLLSPAIERTAQAWARKAAGSLETLLAAKTVLVDLQIKDRDDDLQLDLNPQDKVLHAFAADCNARLMGTSTSAPAAPPRTAPPGGARR
jgi:hypothetical protein